MDKYTVGILIFDDVEVLDFAGPFEVFSTTRQLDNHSSGDERSFRVLTIAERSGMVKCRGGLLVQPHHTIDDHPPLDILLVPGGYGTRREAANPRLLDWIAAQNRTTKLTTSVCTGAFLLAARGLLDNMPATTHWGSIERLKSTHPLIDVRDDVRYVDNGHIVTSAGVSAGIDMALHIVSRLLGKQVAQQTARDMEYRTEDES